MKKSKHSNVDSNVANEHLFATIVGNGTILLDIAGLNYVRCTAVVTFFLNFRSVSHKIIDNTVIVA